MCPISPAFLRSRCLVVCRTIGPQSPAHVLINFLGLVTKCCLVKEFLNFGKNTACNLWFLGLNLIIGLDIASSAVLVKEAISTYSFNDLIVCRDGIDNIWEWQIENTLDSFKEDHWLRRPIKEGLTSHVQFMSDRWDKYSCPTVIFDKSTISLHALFSSMPLTPMPLRPWSFYLSFLEPIKMKIRMCLSMKHHFVPVLWHQSHCQWFPPAAATS